MGRRFGRSCAIATATWGDRQRAGPVAGRRARSLAGRAHADLTEAVLRFCATAGGRSRPRCPSTFAGSAGRSISLRSTRPGHCSSSRSNRSCRTFRRCSGRSIARRAWRRDRPGGGWRVESVSRLLVLPDDRTARRRVDRARERSSTLRFPVANWRAFGDGCRSPLRDARRRPVSDRWPPGGHSSSRRDAEATTTRHPTHIRRLGPRNPGTARQASNWQPARTNARLKSICQKSGSAGRGGRPGPRGAIAPVDGSE